MGDGISEGAPRSGPRTGHYETEMLTAGDSFSSDEGPISYSLLVHGEDIPQMSGEKTYMGYNVLATACVAGLGLLVFLYFSFGLDMWCIALAISFSIAVMRYTPSKVTRTPTSFVLTDGFGMIFWEIPVAKIASLSTTSNKGICHQSVCITCTDAWVADRRSWFACCVCKNFIFQLREYDAFVQDHRGNR
eukprot:CAMPEP_0180519800 /NCGR_PEP_ID=MMETSP1036_2-20121128/55899_1 /TAXON_ID=632150 /ORGANISM="Azadinium spinosum, Strain 3D9" /LENGTH=189 /DNA_ID=CAMNT_0022532199 /DNA_START=54 /DNA_END=623 /DNA_ORIENTATION=-